MSLTNPARARIRCEVLKRDDKDLPACCYEDNEVYFDDGLKVRNIIPLDELCCISVKDMTVFEGKPAVRFGMIVPTSLSRNDFLIEVARTAASLWKDLKVQRPVADLPSSRNRDRHAVFITGEKGAVKTCKDLIIERFVRKREDYRERKLVLNQPQMMRLHESGIVVDTASRLKNQFIHRLKATDNVLCTCLSTMKEFNTIKEKARVPDTNCSDCGQMGVRLSPSTCEHALCPHCMAEFAYESAQPQLCCPWCDIDPNAEALPMSMHVLRLILQEETFEIVVQKALRTFMRTHVEFYVCPRPSCGSLVRDEKPHFEKPNICPGCLETFT